MFFKKGSNVTSNFSKAPVCIKSLRNRFAIFCNLFTRYSKERINIYVSFFLPAFPNLQIPSTGFDNLEPDAIDTKLPLFQTGYLTVKSVSKSGSTLFCVERIDVVRRTEMWITPRKRSATRGYPCISPIGLEQYFPHTGLERLFCFRSGKNQFCFLTGIREGFEKIFAIFA